MLYRKIQENIKEWLADGHEALLITGARQVGKSYIIKNTLIEEKKDFVELNFIDQKEYIEIFNNIIQRGSKEIELAFKAIFGDKLKEGSVIFLDEVQEIKEFITAIKFLVQKSKYKYILSGSLLGVELTNLRSAPVGYLRIIEMYPLDFEEYLNSLNIGNEVLNHLKECYKNKTQVAEIVHKEIMDRFYKYLITGGMPEAVQVFLETGDLEKLDIVHKKIINLYKQDFTKYDFEHNLNIKETYDLIPSELNSKNKRYKFASLDKEFKFNRNENTFLWLKDAGVSIPVYNVTECELPLEASKKSHLFKLFLSDCGLLTSMYGNGAILSLLSHDKSINCGAIFENFIAQELLCHGFKTYYLNSKKHGEIDFLTEHLGKLLPIEVKIGKDYKTHSALRYFLDNNKVDEAIVFSTHNVSVENNITYYPIYMSIFLSNDFTIKEKISLDLSNLKLS